MRTRGRVQRGRDGADHRRQRRRGPAGRAARPRDGARVIAVTSGEAKVEALHEAGADEVIVSRGLDFASEVRKRTAGEGVNVAIEIVGSATFDQTLKAMAPGGRVVVVGNLETGTVNLNPGLVIVKELEILGAYATTREELDEALRLTASGTVRPFVSESCRWRRPGRAHFRLENREVAGRLVLIPPALDHGRLAA